MLPENELIQETREWLLKAEEDLELARYALTAEKPFIAPALFHCQQAAEKALKGFLTWHGVLFRKTHSIEELGEQCVGLEPSMMQVVAKAVPLTEYAWRFRYPGAPFAPAMEEATQAITIAEEVLKTVLNLLPKEVAE
jgi:HEPN domain-containing protein